ncbi:hypothetical protein ACFGVS_23745 [Mucilaginibacter sp. AW1-7]|uniref:hypothetical protein n=1 Tax=Mucilaginibacter sp. AW1-7 TaxID=3349874 RepID=UPI003F73EA57
METNAKNNNGAVKGINTVKADKVEKFVAGNPVNKVSTGADKEEVTPLQEQQSPAKEVTSVPQAQPPAGPVKAEAKPEKPVLNLDGTLELVKILHKRMVQRDNLLNTINTLEAFEVDIEKDAEELGGNYYQGCKLTIEDDANHKFVTKNPVIIESVAQYVNSLCVNKLAEIEAGITIPQA